MEQQILVAKVGAKILEQVAQGKDIRSAFEVVFGAGSYEKLAGEIYDELRSKSQQSN
jgi:hypothetical protein